MTGRTQTPRAALFVGGIRVFVRPNGRVGEAFTGPLSILDGPSEELEPNVSLGSELPAGVCLMAARA